MYSQICHAQEKEIVFMHVDWSPLLTKCIYGQSFSCIRIVDTFSVCDREADYSSSESDRLLQP